MFRVKICGITNLEDARVVAEAGGDAIGLNFFAESPRCCTLEQAKEIASGAPTELCRVGVFVNSTADEIRKTFDYVKLDLVQLHGDEPVEMLHQLRGTPVLRAFRVQNDLVSVHDYLVRCHKLACMPRMALVDAFQPDHYGGTGKALDWQALAAERSQLAGVPLVLAGGLNPSNVAAAIATVRPWAVDTASGVEESPGKKSAALIRAFVEAAKTGFAQTMVRS